MLRRYCGSLSILDDTPDGCGGTSGPTTVEELELELEEVGAGAGVAEELEDLRLNNDNNDGESAEGADVDLRIGSINDPANGLAIRSIDFLY
jgi:hypothetical protein